MDDPLHSLYINLSDDDHYFSVLNYRHHYYITASLAVIKDVATAF